MEVKELDSIHGRFQILLLVKLIVRVAPRHPHKILEQLAVYHLRWVRHVYLPLHLNNSQPSRNHRSTHVFDSLK